MSRYIQILSSFQGLTSTEKCNHQQAEKHVKIRESYPVTDNRKLPIMVLSYESKPVMEDVNFLINCFIASYSANASEKEKIKKAYT